MSTFIYFPCDSKGNLKKGFCPTIADGNSMIRDVLTWIKVKKQFKLSHYAFRLCVGNDYNINPSGMIICKLESFDSHFVQDPLDVVSVNLDYSKFGISPIKK